ncbi:UDP-glucose 4-epimerase [Armadillidium vulgare]|nr:UDP-glucose 4-epimerase [Armadillidium vulgare]
MEDPFLYYKNNLVSTINLLEVMKTNGVFQMVFSSSCSVYGDAKTFPIKESHPYRKCHVSLWKI